MVYGILYICMHCTRIGLICIMYVLGAINICMFLHKYSVFDLIIRMMLQVFIVLCIVSQTFHFGKEKKKQTKESV